MVTDLRDPYPVYHDSYYTMIAYFQGKRIVRDALDNLFFEVIPASSCQVTDLLNRERLTPISELPKQEQAAIREFVANID